MKPTLIVICGCPHVGKAKWAKVIQESHKNCVTVSESNIRYAMFGNSPDGFKHIDDVRKRYYTAVNASLKNYDYVIANATNITCDERDKLFKSLNVDVEKIIGVWIETPMKVAIARNNISEVKHLPQNEIEWCYSNKVSPQEDEPFDDIIFVSDDANLAIGKKRVQILPIVKKLEEI